MVDIQQSDLPKHKVKQLPIFKTGFYGRKNFPGTSMGLRDAIAAWKDIMRGALKDKLQTIESPGINIFKQVEMARKYKEIIPLNDWEDELYIKPDPEALQLVKTEKQKRKVFRDEIHDDKKKLQRKLADRKESVAPNEEKR